MQLTEQQVRQYAYNAGYRGKSLDLAVAIARAESGWKTDAYNSIGNVAGVDRGLMQINSYFHPQISDKCAYDPQCAMNYSYTLSKQGKDFSPWVAYTNDSYRRYLTSTERVAQVQPETRNQPSVTTQAVQSPSTTLNCSTWYSIFDPRCIEYFGKTTGLGIGAALGAKQGESLFDVIKKRSLYGLAGMVLLLVGILLIVQEPTKLVLETGGKVAGLMKGVI
jgi:hypothetical protein